MLSCRALEPLVTPYVDGEASPADRAAIEQHIGVCAPCRSLVVAEQAMHQLLKQRQDGLRARCAPPMLRAACAGHADAAANCAWRQPSAPSWQSRLVPLATAASLVLVVGGVFLYQATERSSRLMAAELAADHMKCFAANTLLGTHDAPAAVERSMMSAFGWQLHLPEQFDASGLELVGSRRCLYAEGRVAHLMYRDNGRPVSIFMLPKRVRPEELVEVLGHEAAIWSSGDRTFVLVTRGSRAEVQRMASFVKAALQ